MPLAIIGGRINLDMYILGIPLFLKQRGREETAAGTLRSYVVGIPFVYAVLVSTKVFFVFMLHLSMNEFSYFVQPAIDATVASKK